MERAKLTPEQRQAVGARLAKARAAAREKREAKEKLIAAAQPKVVAAEVPRETFEHAAPESTEAGAHFANNFVEAVPDPNKPETIPTNFLSGFVKRLEVHGEREGFTRRWFNDDKGGSNIAAARASGWRFVERQDVQLNAAMTPRNTDLGSHVQECVGTNENGSPLFAYLMEIPTWLFEKHQEARIAYNRQLMAQIKGGTLGQRPGDGRYTASNPPPGGTSLPAMSVDTKLYR